MEFHLVFKVFILNQVVKSKKDAFRLALEDFFGQVILLLFHCNYVCTFYIYLYMSSEVRRVFKDLIFQYIRKTRAISADATAHTQVHHLKLNTRRDYNLIGEKSPVHTHITQ